MAARTIQEAEAAGENWAAACGDDGGEAAKAEPAQRPSDGPVLPFSQEQESETPGAPENPAAPSLAQAFFPMRPA